MSSTGQHQGHSGLQVRDLHVAGPHGPIVHGLSLTVEPGSTVAIVGESGSGKSVAAKAITGLLPPGLVARGSVQIAGHPAARVGLLPQNPFTSLSPLHRCGDQIVAAAAEKSRAEMERRLAEVDLPARVARQYPFELSGGMRQRVALAASLASDPDFLIGDEPTTALDVTTQRQVLDLISRIQAERQMGFVLITHDLAVARHQAQSVTVMYAGRVIESGPAAAVLGRPAHPYTLGLRGSEPPLATKLTVVPTMPGSVPHPGEEIVGCVFAARCASVHDQCRVQGPELVATTDGRQVACWHPVDGSVSGPVDLAAPSVAESAPTVAEAAAVPALVTVEGAQRQFTPQQPPALNDVSISLAAGEAVGIVGESGSGKTTLARVLVGLERLDAGTVTWGTELSGPRRAQIVFQDPTSTLNPAMSIGATLREALAAGPGRARVRGRRGNGSSDQAVAELLALVGLPSAYARRRPKALSGGELQRVAIARALAPRPQLLICDEPVSALDVSVQAHVLNLLNEVRQRLGIGLLLITHDLAVARQVVDRAYVMQQGKVVEADTIERILAAPAHPYTQHLIASVVDPVIDPVVDPVNDPAVDR